MTMLSKRKREDTTAADSAGEIRGRRARRQRIQRRSQSEPLRNNAVPAEKRHALRRMFARICAGDLEGNQRPASNPEENQRAALDAEENQRPAADPQQESDNLLTEEEENSLVEDVPADMDPEQLGFLVCAQETLRYLNGLGISYQNPVFNRLRRRLLQGISEIGVA